MTYQELEAAAEAEGLRIFGGFHPDDTAHMPDWTQTLLLLGPEPNFWKTFSATPEWNDGRSDAMDRWSTRVLDEIASKFAGEALFPFGGAPFKPFFSWALQSGHAWQSPVNLLVHHHAGLMVSYRGALALRQRVSLPDRPTRPCDTCSQPCLEACKPHALTANGYNVPACKTFVGSEEGSENKNLGCAVRRSCPVSQSYARMNEQSAYHMRTFLGENR